MLKKMISAVLMTAVALVFCGGIAGCGDDVKKVETHEQTHEEPVETVSPGEPVVESARRPVRPPRSPNAPPPIEPPGHGQIGSGAFVR